MGFANLAAQVIFMFLFISAFFVLFTHYQEYVKLTTEGYDVLSEDLVKRSHTNLEILNASYLAGSSKLSLVNSGSTVLDPDLIDVFVNGTKISRSILTIEIYNQTQDSLYFNPGEAMNVTFFKILSGRVLFQVSTEYGVSAFKQQIIT